MFNSHAFFVSMGNSLKDTMIKKLITDLVSDDTQTEDRFVPYRYDPQGYIKRFLRWDAWAGINGAIGQKEILDVYVLAVRQQTEKQQFDNGELTADQLQYWTPGQPIQNWIKVDSGHGTGKTMIASGIVSHFFDCFAPSITYCFAPTYPQINDLLFKEIRTARRKTDLPGDVLDSPVIKYRANHFVKGRASGGTGKTEKIQGQHDKYMLFVLDEAEGIDPYVIDSIQSMTAGGISIVLMLANPRTKTSRFARLAGLPYVRSLRISCLDHPNVIHGRDVIPGAVTREYISRMIDTHCTMVSTDQPDSRTFSIPWKPGIIYLPDDEFKFRVMGIAPDVSKNTFCPPGRYETAVNRTETTDTLGIHTARIGVDVARYGDDAGTIYLRHNGRVTCRNRIFKQDGYEYYLAVKEILEELLTNGVMDVSIRVDGGGGYGSTLIDNLNRNFDLTEKFKNFSVHEVHFNGTPYDTTQFYDMVTEMYYHAGQIVSVISLVDPPDNLEIDLCERMYTHGTSGGREVKRIVSKENFKKRINRSPDDGDGFVLCVAPDYLFGDTIDIGFA